MGVVPEADIEVVEVVDGVVEVVHACEGQVGRVVLEVVQHGLDGAVVVVGGEGLETNVRQCGVVCANNLPNNK